MDINKFFSGELITQIILSLTTIALTVLSITLVYLVLGISWRSFIIVLIIYLMDKLLVIFNNRFQIIVDENLKE